MNAATQADAGLDYVEEYASAAEWFADHLARSNSRATVPARQGWTVLDLVTHLGNAHSWAATIVETGHAVRRFEDRPPSAKPRRLAQWYLAKAEDLYSVLRDTPPERECWNFAFGTGVVGFWLRREAHETVLHGLDLAEAVGLPERLPVDLADDGVDETLTVFLHRMHTRGYPAELAAPVSLRATDSGRAWIVEPAPRAGFPTQASGEGRRIDRSAPRVGRGLRPGADAVEAPSSVLLKMLWRRVPVDDPRIRLHGNEARLRRFLDSRLTP